MVDAAGAVTTQHTVQPTWMNVSNTSQCHQVESWFYLFFVVFQTLVFLVGLFLNGFTLKVWFCPAQQQASNSVNIYLKNLAAADFLFSLCLPIRIANYAGVSVPVYQAYCTIGAPAFYLNMYASILFMGYIAVNRYLKIVHPLGTHFLQTERAALIISRVTWVFLCITASTYAILSGITQQTVDSVPSRSSCKNLHREDFSIFYKSIHTCSTIIFLCVLLCLLFSYCSTSHRLSQVQVRQPASSSSKKLAKSRRNILVLVSVFCICFVPYHLVRLPYTFQTRRCPQNQVFMYLKELTSMTAILNICLDPLIYFIFSKAFRDQVSQRVAFTSSQVVTRGGKSERGSSDEGQKSTVKLHRKTVGGSFKLPHTKKTDDSQ